MSILDDEQLKIASSSVYADKLELAMSFDTCVPAQHVLFNTANAWMLRTLAKNSFVCDEVTLLILNLNNPVFSGYVASRKILSEKIQLHIVTFSPNYTVSDLAQSEVFCLKAQEALFAKGTLEAFMFLLKCPVLDHSLAALLSIQGDLRIQEELSLKTAVLFDASFSPFFLKTFLPEVFKELTTGLPFAVLDLIEGLLFSWEASLQDLIIATKRMLKP